MNFDFDFGDFCGKRHFPWTLAEVLLGSPLCRHLGKANKKIPRRGDFYGNERGRGQTSTPTWQWDREKDVWEVASGMRYKSKLSFFSTGRTSLCTSAVMTPSSLSGWICAGLIPVSGFEPAFNIYSFASFLIPSISVFPQNPPPPGGLDCCKPNPNVLRWNNTVAGWGGWGGFIGGLTQPLPHKGRELDCLEISCLPTDGLFCCGSSPRHISSNNRFPPVKISCR